MKRKNIFKSLIALSCIAFIAALQIPSLNAVNEEMLFTYVPSLPTPIMDVKISKANNRTVFDVTNNLNKIDLSVVDLEKVLSQNSGKGSTTLSVYGNVKGILNKTGKYKEATYEGDNSVWTNSTDELEPLNDTLPIPANNLFDFWPEDMKVVYRKDVNSPWIYKYDKITTKNMTIKARLALELGIKEDKVIENYNKLYRFEANEESRTNVTQYEFYSSVTPGPTADAGSNGNFNRVNLTLLGIEGFEVRYHNAIKVTSVTLNKEGTVNLLINETLKLSSVVAPSNSAYQKVKYDSSDPTVATVDKYTGEVKALKEGSVIITATSEGKTDTVTLNIKKETVVTEKLPDNATDVIKASAGSDVDFQVTTPPTVDKNIFNEAKNNDTTIGFNIVNDKKELEYSWTFESKNLKPNATSSIDLSLSLTTAPPDAIKKDVEALVKKDKSLFVNFTHHGELPGKATMKLNVSNKYKDGALITLYYYNETTKKLDILAKDILVKKGFVEFEISHCSSYVLTEQPPVKNPQTGDINIAAITLISILSVVGFAFSIKLLKA
ncbi:MAG: Ig-like domain-containing protein [Bacilli bacterium]